MLSDKSIPQAATGRGDTPGTSSPAAFPLIREDGSMSFAIPDLAAHTLIPAGYTVISGSVRVPRWCGDVTDNDDGSWTFQPAPGYHGQAPISFRMAAPQGQELAGSVLAEVLPVNDAPVAGHVDLGQCAAGSRRIFTSYDLLSASHDTDGDGLTIVSANVTPEQGRLQSLGNNYWAFTPAQSFAGQADITFEISDGTTGTVGTASLEVMPAGSNRPPLVSPANLGATAEDTPFLITEARLRFGSRDPDGDPLRVVPESVTVDEAYGSITDNGNGTWTFTPTADLHQEDVRISFALSDGRGGWTKGTALLDIRPVNDAPMADDIDLGIILEDHALTFSKQLLLAGAHDVDGDPLDVSSVTVDPAFGTVTDNADDTWTFTPLKDLSGIQASLTFTLTDGHGGQTAARAAIGILPIDDAPVAADVILGSTPEDTAVTFSLTQLLAASHDAEGDPLDVVSLAVDSAFGTITDNGDDTWTFTPRQDLSDVQASLAFTLSDELGNQASARAFINILPVNDVPVVADVDLGDTNEDTAMTFSSAQLLANASDVDGDDLSIAAVIADPSQGTITDNRDGTWTFTPLHDLSGFKANLAFTVTDGNGGEASARAAIDILPVNDAPVTEDVDLGMASANVPVTFTLAQLLENASDVEGDPLRVDSVTVDPAHGVVTDNGDDTWTFTPAHDFHGEDIPLSFTVSDGNGGFATAAALLDVLPNHAPVVPDQDLGSLDEDTNLFFTSAQLLRGASDLDGDRLFVESVTVDPAYGALTAISADEWQFNPTENFNGEVFLDFTVSDGKRSMAEAVARVEYLPVNDAPHAGSFSLTTNEDESLKITKDMIFSQCNDVDGDSISLKFISLANPAAGKLLIHTVDGESFYEFKPTATSVTPAVLNYTIRDVHNATSTGRIDITVNAVADPLNATNTIQGYVDGLHRLDLDFSAQFPEHDGSEIYTLLSLSGLDALPLEAQLISGGEVIWSAGDGDTLHLTQEQSMGLADVFVRSPEAASFDIAVRTHTVEQSNNGHTAYGMSTVHVDIADRPLLATYQVAETNQAMPDVFWYQNGDDWSAPTSILFSNFSEEERFLNLANSPVLFNNADPSDPDAIIGSVDWHGDENCLIHVEGYSTELNTLPGYAGNANWAFPYVGQQHGAMFDFWMFRWNMNDQGNTNNIFSPHLRQQYGDQTMQIVSSRIDSEFFEARSVVMGYMNESYWLHDRTVGDYFGFDNIPHPEYLQPGWDSRFLFGSNGSMIDVLVGDLSLGGDVMNNVLVGLGGDDRLKYGQGHDTLLGGPGNDVLLIDTNHNHGFLDSYALTDYVIPHLSTNFASPGEYGFYTVVDGKIDGGEGFDTLQLTRFHESAGETTLYLNYAEHWIGNEPATHDIGRYSTTNAHFRHFSHPYVTNDPWYSYIDGQPYGNFATFKYNMINLEQVDLTGDVDDANTLNLNLDNVWLVTSNEYDKTLYVTGDANDTLEIRDQANWHYVGTETGVVPLTEWTKTLPANAEYHHLVSNTGVAHIYVSEDVDVHVVGDTRYNGVGKIVWEADDSLSVDPFFQTVLAGGGDDTITIDPILLTDGRFDLTEFSLIDGGDGFDVLKLGVNQAVMNDVEMWLVNNVSPLQINNIEAIDISGNIHQANTVIMHSGTVFNVTDANNVLYIQGDANDTAYLSDAEVWSHVGTSERGGLTYDYYTFTDGPGTTMDLYIQAQMLTNMGHV